MRKHRSSLINHSFVQREADAAVECASIRQSEGVLQVLDRPTGVWRTELKLDAWDAMGLAKGVCSVVDNLDFNKVPVKVLHDDVCIFDKSFPNGHVPHDQAYTSFLQLKDVGGDSVVSLESEKVRGDVFVRGFRVFFDGISAVEKTWERVRVTFERERQFRTFFSRNPLKDLYVEVVDRDVLGSEERSL